MKRTILLTIAMAALVVGCAPKAPAVQTISVAGGSYRSVTAQELNKMLRDKDFVFVNVHYPFAGNIAGTDVSIPYDQIDQQLSLLPPEKSAKILLYCRSGHMSTLAAESLVQLGYTNVWTLEAGMQAWEAAGFSLQLSK
jgi:rhodanese-related sulfurtransferase